MPLPPATTQTPITAHRRLSPPPPAPSACRRLTAHLSSPPAECRKPASFADRVLPEHYSPTTRPEPTYCESRSCRSGRRLILPQVRRLQKLPHPHSACSPACNQEPNPHQCYQPRSLPSHRSDYSGSAELRYPLPRPSRGPSSQKIRPQGQWTESPIGLAGSCPPTTQRDQTATRLESYARPCSAAPQLHGPSALTLSVFRSRPRSSPQPSSALQRYRPPWPFSYPTCSPAPHEPGASRWQALQELRPLQDSLPGWQARFPDGKIVIRDPPAAALPESGSARLPEVSAAFRTASAAPGLENSSGRTTSPPALCLFSSKIVRWFPHLRAAACGARGFRWESQALCQSSHLRHGYPSGDPPPVARHSPKAPDVRIAPPRILSAFRVILPPSKLRRSERLSHPTNSPHKSNWPGRIVRASCFALF